MFRAVRSVLKRNKEAFYGIARGSTSPSHRAFTTVNSASSSSPLAANSSFNGLRSLLKVTSFLLLDQFPFSPENHHDDYLDFDRDSVIVVW